MANIPPIQFKRSHHAGSQPTSSDLAVGELAINFPDGKLYSKDSDGTIITLGGGGSSATDSDQPVTVLDWKDSAATIQSTKGAQFTVFVEKTIDSDWYTQADIAASARGSRVHAVTYVRGERTEFDSSTKIWLDGTTTTNQAPSPGSMTFTSNGNSITDGPATLETHYTDTMNLDPAAPGSYTARVISCRDQNRHGIYGFSNGNDYLIRFYWQHDNVTMSNNYTRLFGFTDVNQATTGTTTASIDPQNNCVYYVGCINNETQGRIGINDAGTAVTFNWPNGNIRAADAKQLATFSCDYVSTGNWTIRFWLDGTFIDEQTGINLTASNVHFQFGTGNSADDRDGNHSFTHLQVDEYTSGNLPTRFVSTSALTETDNLYKSTPTVAYDKNYFLTQYNGYIKVGAAGSNSVSDWFNTSV